MWSLIKNGEASFEFTVVSRSGGKSNVCFITSLATCNNKVYVMPEEVQPASYHKEIMKTVAFSKVKNSLKRGNK